MRSLAFMSLALLAGCTAAPAPSAEADRPPADRAFRITYKVQLTGLPAKKPIRLWVPMPLGEPYQRDSNHSIASPWKERYTVEPGGTTMIYFEGDTGAGGDQTVTVSYDVERWERTTDLAAFATDAGPPQAGDANLKPSRLVVVDERLAGLAEELSVGKSSTLAKARAFYDHVLGEMSYDKSGEGWGRGDSLFACDAKRGNCTDYHAYFMALCLAAKIPSRFQIGLYGHYETKPEEYETGGYHCWAEFKVPGHGWVPVDLSEGDKNPERREYFFGAHTPNRVTLSQGRDLTLEPPQAGPPLNYFLYPYCEVDGVPFEGAKKVTRWKDKT